MGRALTPDEEELRERRRKALPSFLEERMLVLADFAERLELQTPAMITTEPERYLAAIDEFMRRQEIAEDDRIWILTRMGYYIGELLVQRLGGRWFLNEIPDSRYFLHYVVGKFSHAANPSAMVAPFEVAAHFVAQPPGRSLVSLVSEVESEVLAI
ncbi:MAG: hypothetical protein JW889_08070 [Verrucomicrobia bacterium]|nr:hypothetical protein [Verrucomicrobiota bacterium]